MKESIRAEFSRRGLLVAMAALPVADAVADASETAAPGAASRTLVAYFSRSGNTRVVAGLIQRAIGADVFEIKASRPYPEDYLQTVAQASDEKKRGFEPALAENVAGIAKYDTVYLGFPIWGETAPSIIRSFLSAHELSGKILIPFITHGGFGLGDSHAVLGRHAPRAKLRPGFSMQADQERQTMNSVLGWLKETA